MLADTLWITTKVVMAVILNVDEVIRNLEALDFVDVHLFNMGGRHPTEATDTLLII